MVATGQPAAPADLETLHEVAQQLRIDGIRASTRAGSGHPLQHVRRRSDRGPRRPAPPLRLRPPQAPTNDHLIFSKGHASPLLYALYLACGAIDDAELMTYRTLGSGSRVTPPRSSRGWTWPPGHSDRAPIGVGVALAGKYLDRLPYRVWVLCGDSELAEGSIWEALDRQATTSWTT